MAAPPLIMTDVPKKFIEAGDSKYVDEFVEQTCRITKESWGGSAGQLLKMRPWQKNLTSMIFARYPDDWPVEKLAGRYRHRQALIGLPRKNGKSALGSAFALYSLIMGPDGGEVYSCAVDKEQAKIVFDVAKKMVAADPILSDMIAVRRDYLEYTETGSIYKVLSSEAPTKEGLNPSTIIYDELHAAPNDELYSVMRLAQGARKDPLMIVITTAGVKTDTTGGDSTCYRLYQQGEKVATGEIDNPSFFMAWWGAPEGADYKDPKVWAEANPGYDDLIDTEDFKSVLHEMTENQFRTKRLNQWVSSAEAWLPSGAWDGCRNSRDFVPGNRGVVLGFDGSRGQDSTALVACTIDSDPQIRVLGHWAIPEDPVEAAGWRVPRGEVKDAIRQACRDYNVREIAADEWIWQDALEELAEEGLPIVPFSQTMQAMAPATQRFYERVTTQRIGHDGDKRLKRHLGNAILKEDTRGSRLIKDKPGSMRKIDLAVAAVMALDRADFWLTQAPEGSYVWKDGAGNEHHKPVSEVGFVW